MRSSLILVFGGRDFKNEENNVTQKRFPADWEQYGKVSRPAT